jgi:hypothetical protein
MSPALREAVEVLDRFDAVHTDGLKPFREVVTELTRTG